mgnify:CR=1 FL=1
MFCFKAGVFLKELKKHSPIVYNSSLKAFNNSNQDNIIRIKHDDMLAIPEDSIDYAVMEKTSKGVVIPFSAGWNDLGSFDALWQTGQKDANDNVIKGDGLTHDVKES